MTGPEARARRLAIGAKQIDVAELAGVSSRTVGDFERGCAKRRGPQRSTTQAIDGALRQLETRRSAFRVAPIGPQGAA
jgi:transcriptional regulator with XRE-family HTH domain